MAFQQDTDWTVSADGDSDHSTYRGGEGYFTAQGTFGGGTLTLQFSVDGETTWSAVGDDATLTASGGAVVNLPPCSVRVSMASSTTPSVVAKTVIYK